jgi:hypothetical protein
LEKASDLRHCTHWPQPRQARWRSLPALEGEGDDDRRTHGLMHEEPSHGRLWWFCISWQRKWSTSGLMSSTKKEGELTPRSQRQRQRTEEIPKHDQEHWKISRGESREKKSPIKSASQSKKIASPTIEVARMAPARQHHLRSAARRHALPPTPWKRRTHDQRPCKRQGDGLEP